MPRESKSVRVFLDTTTESCKRHNSNPKANLENICNYITKLSDREFSKLVSDKYWVKYPFFTCWPNRTGRRSYGGIIGTLVHELCQYSSRHRKLQISKSEGIFLSYTIDYTSGKDRLKVSSRALKSKDGRAKLRAVRVLPVGKIKNLVSDSNTSVRNMVLKRVGIDNCADKLIGDKSGWIRTRAIIASDNLSDSYIREQIDLLKKSNRTDWYAHWELLALVQKLSDEELLYFLDLGDGFSKITEHISKRLQYANIDINSEIGG